MWLLSQQGVDPAKIAGGSGPYYAVVAVLLIAVSGLSLAVRVLYRDKRDGDKEQAAKLLELAEKVLPVLADATNELRRLMGREERGR